MKTARLTVRLTEDQVRQLREIVGPLDVPVSHALRSIVRAYLADVESFRTQHRQGGARSLVAMLDGLGGALRSLDMKARSVDASTWARSPDTHQRVAQMERKLIDAAASLYDAFLAEGMDRKTALSRTNEALKASDFPWTTYETTKTMLRRSGRFKALPQGSLSGRPDRAK